MVAVIEGSRPGKTIGLRADSDALPLEEKTGVEWSSKVPMAMHACDMTVMSAPCSQRFTILISTEISQED